MPLPDNSNFEYLEKNVTICAGDQMFGYYVTAVCVPFDPINRQKVFSTHRDLVKCAENPDSLFLVIGNYDYDTNKQISDLMKVIDYETHEFYVMIIVIFLLMTVLWSIYAYFTTKRILVRKILILRDKIKSSTNMDKAEPQGIEEPQQEQELPPYSSVDG